MTVPSHFHMPGAFHGEGVHSSLFRPPMSPGSSATFGYASPRATHDVYATKRKRNRHDLSRSQDIRMDGDLDKNGFFGTPVAQMRNDDRRYQLAGQLDTPNGGPYDSGNLGESMYNSDFNYRKTLGSKRAHDEIDRSAIGPTQLFNLPSQPIPSQGWGSFAFSTIGGVVGKVWEFCTSSAFRGFQAGGGKAFAMTAGRVEELPLADEKQQVNNQHVPGRFPPSQDNDYFGHQPDSLEETINSGASTPTGPAPKRRHTDNRDELGRNWVIVSDQKFSDQQFAAPKPTPPPRRASHRPTPRSRNSGPSMATGRRISTPASRFSGASTPTQRRPASRPSSRLSHAPTPPLLSPTLASTASFASARSPSPSKIPQPSRRRNSVAPSSTPTLSSHRRSHSNASTASPRASVEASPRLNAEAKHLAARRKMEERDTDVRINAFNKQLQDMIRQGREALGTTIEVEGNWEDDDL
ncbi:hypothetical protein FALBO_9407 [Fusarium albosuccineum]|uniref:Uncharacterized protein n=1 Tax=Fusarium albosuccineum TaxID=1237068 RepID=A0A8H4P917_9HYPO|nr:hypothetical protein FALBO_9407 [Fusarium albosuccineum]